MNQKRMDSVVVKGSIVLVLAFLIKYFWKIEIEDKTVEAIVIVGYAIYQVFASMNNPKEKKKF